MREFHRKFRADPRYRRTRVVVAIETNTNKTTTCDMIAQWMAMEGDERLGGYPCVIMSEESQGVATPGVTLLPGMKHRMVLLANAYFVGHQVAFATDLITTSSMESGEAFKERLIEQLTRFERIFKPHMGEIVTESQLKRALLYVYHGKANGRTDDLAMAFLHVLYQAVMFHVLPRYSRFWPAGEQRLYYAQGAYGSCAEAAIVAAGFQRACAPNAPERGPWEDATNPRHA